MVLALPKELWTTPESEDVFELLELLSLIWQRMGQPFELLDGKEKNKNQFMAVVDMCGIQGEAPKNITETTYMEKTYSVLGR